MAIVHREIQRLNVLIGDLLDYANPRPEQPRRLRSRRRSSRRPLQVARGEQAFATIERRDARSTEPLPLHADPAKLRQVAVEPRAQRAPTPPTAAASTSRVDARRARATTRSSRSPTTARASAPSSCARIFDPFFTTKQQGHRPRPRDLPRDRRRARRPDRRRERRRQGHEDDGHAADARSAIA